MRKALIATVLLLLIAFDGYVLSKHPYASVFPPFSELPTLQIFTDLGVALGLFSMWMIDDVRRQGKPLYRAIPHLVTPILFGAIGPLVYLLLRDDKAARS